MAPTALLLLASSVSTASPPRPPPPSSSSPPPSPPHCPRSHRRRCARRPSCPSPLASRMLRWWRPLPARARAHHRLLRRVPASRLHQGRQRRTRGGMLLPPASRPTTPRLLHRRRPCRRAPHHLHQTAKREKEKPRNSFAALVLAEIVEKLGTHMEELPFLHPGDYISWTEWRWLDFCFRLTNGKKDAPDGEKPEPVSTHLHNMIIVPEMIGSLIGVYNGQTFNQVEIKLEMIGHYLA